MKILLLNDNPVVRKLVALSAQKTKDDLSVIWSVDEVEEGTYDLLIVDDAHYSDESMAALKEKIKYKTSLLMATRGNATPSGFDKIINKPFLPTDLVDLFVQIAQGLTEPSEEKSTDVRKAIVLEDTFEDGTQIDEDINLDDFDIEGDNEAAVKTNVLDHEEVQELQDLLDDTENFGIDDELSLDTFMEDEERADPSNTVNNDDLLESLDDDILQALEGESSAEGAENELEEAMEEFDFDEELLLSEEEPAKAIEEDADEFDALLLDDLADMDEDEELSALESADAILSDDEFGELEQQIQEAVEELGIEDLEEGADSIGIGDFDEFEGLGDLDRLSEREIKLAIGEEVEEEPDIRIGYGNHGSLDVEAFGEEMGEFPKIELDDEFENIDIDAGMVSVPEQEYHQGTPAEGMEALQALLKALSNEEVAKTLKGLSININIHFGNDK